VIARSTMCHRAGEIDLATIGEQRVTIGVVGQTSDRTLPEVATRRAVGRTASIAAASAMDRIRLQIDFASVVGNGIAIRPPGGAAGNPTMPRRTGCCRVR
jgi:hypothetical protein